MREPRPVARTRVFSIGFLVGLFGLTLLLALAVIARASTGWRFAFLVLPVVFGALAVLETLRSAKSPDEKLYRR